MPSHLFNTSSVTLVTLITNPIFFIPLSVSSAIISSFSLNIPILPYYLNYLIIAYQFNFRTTLVLFRISSLIPTWHSTLEDLKNYTNQKYKYSLKFITTGTEFTTHRTYRLKSPLRPFFQLPLHQLDEKESREYLIELTYKLQHIINVF